MTAHNAAETPLTVNSAPSPTADLFDVKVAGSSVPTVAVRFDGGIKSTAPAWNYLTYTTDGNTLIGYTMHDGTDNSFRVASGFADLALTAQANVHLFAAAGKEVRLSDTADRNTAIGGAGSYGGGQGVLFLANDTADPVANPTGGGVLFVSGGALKYRGSAGTITTIAPA